MSQNNFLSALILDPRYNKQMDWKVLYPEEFFYNLDIGAVANGATVSGSIQIQADASFLLMCMAGTLVNANTQSASFGNTQVIDAVVNIQDTGSGKNLMSAPVQFAHLFGQNGENSYELTVPRIIQNNSTLVVTLTNNSGAAITRAGITFMGCKLLNRR